MKNPKVSFVSLFLQVVELGFFPLNLMQFLPTQMHLQVSLLCMFLNHDLCNKFIVMKE